MADLIDVCSTFAKILAVSINSESINLSNFLQTFFLSIAVTSSAYVTCNLIFDVKSKVGRLDLRAMTCAQLGLDG